MRRALAVLALLLLPAVARAQDERPCSVIFTGVVRNGVITTSTRYVTTADGQRHTFVSGGVDATCAGQGNRLLGDSAEPKLARARKRALGRVLRSPTLFEDVIKTIFTTNTLWGATKNMTRKLVDEFGAPLSSAGRVVSSDGETRTETKSFPTPEYIAASTPDFIQEKIRVGYRAPAVHDLAVRVASGKYDLEALKTSSLPTLELRRELMTIKGVGPTPRRNLLLILGRSDFIPVDSWALKLVSHEWYKDKPITAKEVEKRFEKWGEYKGLAFWFWDWKYNQ